MLFINPEECIECWACVSECPTESIYQQDEVPEEWHDFIGLNREMAEQCPQITEKQTPLCG